MTRKYDSISSKTLGCKVPPQFYNRFLAKADQLDMTPSMLMRDLLMEGIDKKIAEMPRIDATPKPKPKRKRYLVNANNSVLEQISPRVFESPDISLLIKPYPPDCNPINYDTPEKKMGALVRRMRCLHIRAMMIQRSGSSKQ